jgi:hypothetical protein
MSKPSRKGIGGRPRTELEDKMFNGWEQLEALIPWATGEYIANMFEIDYDTLNRRIQERYSMSFSELKALKQEGIRLTLFKKQLDVALQGNPALLIWMGKQYLGQTEKVQTENIEAKDTQALVVEAKQLLAKHSDEDRRDDDED